MSKESNCYCTNCGEKVEGLFKKYSETVLKLTECVRLVHSETHSYN